jgi:hypothetical protein
MQTRWLALITGIAAAGCGGSAKKGPFTPSATADVKCYEGARDLGNGVQEPRVLKLVMDAPQSTVAMNYWDRAHSQGADATGLYTWTNAYEVGQDGAGDKAAFTGGSPFAWTNFEFKIEFTNADGSSAGGGSRTGTIGPDGVTATESSTMNVLGMATTSNYTEKYTPFDCAQLDAKLAALPKPEKK